MQTIRGKALIPRKFHHCSIRCCSSLSPQEITYRRLTRHVAPYQHLDHEEQLQRLSSWAQASMKKVYNILIHNIHGENKIEWTKRSEQYENCFCPVLPIRPSPITCGYRNKDDLVIGPGVDGDNPEIGFYVPPGKFPNMRVSGIKLKMQKKEHHEIARVFGDFVCRSGIPALGMTLSRGGHWRSLLIRSNEAGDTMVDVSVNPYGASEGFPDQTRDLVHQFFAQGEGRHLGVNSLFFTQCSGYRSRTARVTTDHLWGPTSLTETVLGHTFRISPQAFFQVNTRAAEVLYGSVRELCGLGPRTVLLDLCCGTGTIGVLFSKHVRKVLAIEEMAEAVADARVNAQNNGCENVEFFCGRAEKLIGPVLEEHTAPGDDIVAVVNPGRGGLGKKVTRALRRCEGIRKVVYVSCKPLGRAAFNFVELTRHEDDTYRGPPYTPVVAVPVDMFPTTKHVELIVQFQR